MSDTAVIIPSKTASNLATCLAALRKCEPDLDVIVVDDGIGQPFLDRAGDFAPIAVAPGVKPFVFSRNVNLGIRAAGLRTGYVLLNDDALLESPGGFCLLAKTCEDHPHVGIIGAVTNLTGQPLQRPATYLHAIRFGRGVRIVPHIAFIAVYIPQRTIDAVGCLDERFVGYGCEDADYCEQVTRAGLKVAVHDTCYVDHARLHSTYRGEPGSAGDFSGNLKLLMQKWGRLQTQPRLAGRSHAP